MSLLTPNRFSRIVNIPITLAQTELRRSKSIRIGDWAVKLGQKLQVKCLTVHLVKVLTPGPLADYNNTALGMASVGVYFGPMMCSPLVYASAGNVGAFTVNPFTTYTFLSPGIYSVVLSNNTNNLDLSVVVTGSLKLYT